MAESVVSNQLTFNSFQMENSKKITPEEILNPKTISTRNGGAVYVYDAVKAINQYAVQEVSEAKENATWAHDQLHKKDTLLKEAIKKGQELYNALMSIHLQFGDESHAFQMSNELYHWCDFIHTNNLTKATGSEAGK